MAEQGTHNPLVAGSSPAGPTIGLSSAPAEGRFSWPSTSRGLEPVRSEAVKQTRQWRVCRPTVRAREREDVDFEL